MKAFELNRSLSLKLVLLLVFVGVAGCRAETVTTSDTSGDDTLIGAVRVDGSSTVFPISEAMAEKFMVEYPGVRVTVGVSGTGGGFSRFCGGETDINNASRPITQREIDACAENGIEYIELPVAFDGLSVVVNQQNDWATCLTIDELGAMWEPDAQGTITNWNQVRDNFPDASLGLFGAGTDSGTYDFFMDAVVGATESRGDFTASEDDNVIVQGVAADPNSLGFFGFAYYLENQDRLRLVAIDGGEGCVAPSPETIADGTYFPLSRPEFIYVRTTSLEDPAVRAFTEFHIADENKYLISEVGYVPLPPEYTEKVRARLDGGVTGSVFEGGSPVGVSLKELL